MHSGTSRGSEGRRSGRCRRRCRLRRDPFESMMLAIRENSTLDSVAIDRAAGLRLAARPKRAESLRAAVNCESDRRRFCRALRSRAQPPTPSSRVSTHRMQWRADNRQSVQSRRFERSYDLDCHSILRNAIAVAGIEPWQQPRSAVPALASGEDRSFCRAGSRGPLAAADRRRSSSRRAAPAIVAASSFRRDRQCVAQPSSNARLRRSAP